MAVTGQSATDGRVPKRRRAGRKARSRCLAVAVASLSLLVLSVSLATAASAPEFLTQFCSSGTAGERCSNVRGLAADPSTGHIYAADSSNLRISEFTSWGEFVKAWGWGVRDGAAELQTCTAATGCLVGSRGASAGQFGAISGGPGNLTLNSGSDLYVVDGALNGGRVQRFSSAGEFELMFGGGVVTGGASGVGTIKDGSKTITAVSVTDSAFVEGQTVTGKDIPPGTTVAAVANTSITLSKAPIGGECPSPAGCVGESLSVAAGSGNVPTNERHTLTVSATGGSYKLKFVAPKPQSVPVEQTTASIPFDAPASGAGSVQEALENLTSIGTGNVAVSEPSPGTYEIEFIGKYADTALNNANSVTVTTLGITGSTLTGGNANVSMVQKGASAGEVCTAAADCQRAAVGTGPGQFTGEALVSGTTFVAGIAIDSTGRVYVGDDGRIQRFSANGVWEADLGTSILGSDGIVEGLAIDAEDHIYAISHDLTGAVRELDSSGTTLLDTIPVAQPQALATDVDKNLYVVSGSSNPEVVEFDQAGTEVARFAGGDFTNSRAIATGLLGDGTMTTGDVYVGSSANGNGYVRAYGPEPQFEPPPRIEPEILAGSEQAVDVTTSSATLEAEINPHFWDTGYFVEYGAEDCAVGPCERAPVPPGVLTHDDRGANRVAVHLTGLASGTTYHYRFIASSRCNAAEPAEECVVEGSDHTFSTFLVPPNALPDNRAYEMVSPAEKNSAELPNFPGASGGGVNSQSVAPVQASPSGGSISYHSGTAFGEAESSPAVSQYSSTRGSGGWAYENINPRFEEGVLRDPFVGFSSDLAHAAVIALEPSLTSDATLNFPNLYRRDSGGAFIALTDEAHRPELAGEKAEYCLSYAGASADFAHVFFAAKGGALIEGDPLATGVNAVYAVNLYEWHAQPVDARQELLVAATGGQYSLTAAFTTAGAKHSETTQPLAVTANAAEVRAAIEALPSIGSGNVRVVGGPGDATGSAPYTIEFIGALAGTYVRTLKANDLSLSGGSEEATVEVVASGGHLRFVSVLPNGSPAVPNENQSPNQNTGFGQRAYDNTCNMTQSPLRHAVSSDGSKAFWTYGGAYTTPNFALNPLLASVDGKETVQLDANQGGSAFISGSGAFLDATPSGDRAFFSAPGLLTPGAGSKDLYMYDFHAREKAIEEGITPAPLVNLTPNGGVAANVQGVLGVSEGGDYVYFVATGALTPPGDENEAGEHSEPGKNNVYLWHETGAGSELGFITQLSGEDSSAWTMNPKEQDARVAPDGSYLAFISVRSLTGYDSRIADGSSACAINSEGSPVGGPNCKEAFIYSARSDQLTCASCNPSGARPLGPPAKEEEGGETSFPGWSTPYEQPRYLGSGGRLFFMSRDKLSPRDTNGKQDVYQWEPVGIGSCTASGPSFSKSNRGCVNLISTGESGDDSWLLDASSSGNDVFISTRQRLTWADDDERFDVYDARVGGGFAKPVPPPSCEGGEECRGSGTSAGPQAAVGTSTFHGPGNVRSTHQRPRCRKGTRKVRRHGKVRCVKRHGRKRHKHHHRRERGRAIHHDRRTSR